jgi:DNA modification methylase
VSGKVFGDFTFTKALESRPQRTPVELNKVYLGDCLELLKALPEASVDCVICDPPYGLGTKQPTRADIIKYLQGDRLDTGGDFMGKDWEIPPVSVWEQCYRVLKPGGHLLAFAGTRTFDMMSVGIRAAGFEDRDTVASMFGPSVLQWVYGAGFPKSLDIAKAIDKMLNVKGKLIRTEGRMNEPSGIVNADRGAGAREFVEREIREPASEQAKKWAGWGTALKPAWEPILCFRKPAGQATTRTVLENGVGALNVGECRIGNTPRINQPAGNVAQDLGGQGNSLQMSINGMPADAAPTVTVGRWPANVILSHAQGCKLVGTKQVKGSLATSGGDPEGHGKYAGRFPRGDGRLVGYGDADGLEEVEEWECAPNCPVSLLDQQSGISKSSDDPTRFQGLTKFPNGHYVNSKAAAELTNDLSTAYGDEGGASRFFTTVEPESSFYYTAKASRTDRNDGLDSGQKGTYEPGELCVRDNLDEEELAALHAIMPETASEDFSGLIADKNVVSTARKYFRQAKKGERGNMHVTVKPVALMRWLVRLVTPKGGLVLDPYSGSGTTLVAAAEEGMDFIGIELDPAYHKIASKRALAVANKRATKEAEADIFNLMMNGDE